MALMPKVLEADEGCEQVSRSYHIAAGAIRSSSSKGVPVAVLRERSGERFGEELGQAVQEPQVIR